MKLNFNERFLLGTSSAACHIEDVSLNDWSQISTREGECLRRNIEHEQHSEEDAKIITQLGNAYRYNPDWSKLQQAPFSQLETSVVEQYRTFFGLLKDKGLHLMLTLHHFSNPLWFSKKGGWTTRQSEDVFIDYTLKFTTVFNDLVDSWNTINEPASYAGNAFLLGFFPPSKKNPFSAIKVLKNMSAAHRRAYRLLKHASDSPVGVSNINFYLHPTSFLSVIPAQVADYILHKKIPDMFQPTDFTGISYYGGILFTPSPKTEVQNPGQIAEKGLRNDKMWEYAPQHLEKAILTAHSQYRKPIIITENGCCTDRDEVRIQAIKDYLTAVKNAQEKGADVRGYFHWTTFDCPEHHLGWNFPFGLVEVNRKTMQRKIKPSGKYYSSLSKNKL